MLENSRSMNMIASSVPIMPVSGHQKGFSLQNTAQKDQWRISSSRFECNPILLDEITQRLVKEFEPEQVILFGSHAWGRPNQDSDIDLMVIVKHSTQSDYERTLRGYRGLSGINIPKDIIVKTKAEFDFFRFVRASLEYKIVAEGKVLYEQW